jgi:hypothetical protein
MSGSKPVGNYSAISAAELATAMEELASTPDAEAHNRCAHFLIDATTAATKGKCRARSTSITGRHDRRPSRVRSVAREIGVECNRKLPTGPAEVLSITGSVGAHGGRVFRSIEMRAERSRHHQHMLVWENIMKRRIALRLTGAVVAAALLAFDSAAPSLGQTLTAQQQLAFDIYKELVEINTVAATGDTGRAADAMAARLRAAGFSGDDLQVFKPALRKGNLVARLRGTGVRKPILLLAHLDVVEALPTDWSFDPFKLTEKDGYYYGRGTADDKFMAATFVANLIRYKQEGYRPDRDIIVALETDEEIGDVNALGIRWLIKNHRDLIDAEFALNEGGSVGLKHGKPIRNGVQTSEKVQRFYRLEALNKGGHSSVPSPDNAIYHLPEGLAKLAKFSFPLNLNATRKNVPGAAIALGLSLSDEARVATRTRSSCNALGGAA